MAAALNAIEALTAAEREAAVAFLRPLRPTEDDAKRVLGCPSVPYFFTTAGKFEADPTAEEQEVVVNRLTMLGLKVTHGIQNPKQSTASKKRGEELFLIQVGKYGKQGANIYTATAIKYVKNALEEYHRNRDAQVRKDAAIAKIAYAVATGYNFNGDVEEQKQQGEYKYLLDLSVLLPVPVDVADALTAAVAALVAALVAATAAVAAPVEEGGEVDPDAAAAREDADGA